MLKIINNLGPFFEDCYRSISVREYARLIHTSPPTASKLLKTFAKEGYLHQREERRHLFFTLIIENEEVIDLGKLYWKCKLRTLSKEFQLKLTGASAVLFGSLAKAEVMSDSDIDIAIFSPEKKALKIEHQQKTFGRDISLHWFNCLKDIKNEHLLKNILNGVILFGKLKWE